MNTPVDVYTFIRFISLDRMSMSDVDDYVLNRVSYNPLIRVPYIFECINRLSSNTILTSDVRLLCGKVIGTILGSILFDQRPVAHQVYKSAMDKRDTIFMEQDAIAGIRLAATFGKLGSVRFICTNFATDIIEADMFESAMLLSKATNVSGNFYVLNSLFRMCDAEPGLCPIRSIFRYEIIISMIFQYRF